MAGGVKLSESDVNGRLAHNSIDEVPEPGEYGCRADYGIVARPPRAPA
jgi:hypothetical protein